MLYPPRVMFQLAFALGLCVNSTGCIFLGAYPFVQDVPGPVRGIRVIDSETKADVPNAQVSLNAESGLIRQYDSHHNGIKGANASTEDPEDMMLSGFLSSRDPMREGLLPREDDGAFKVGQRLRFLPGIADAGITFSDGPKYYGPFGEYESGYIAVVTASAPGYKPVQIRYHAPLFAKFQVSTYRFDCPFNPKKGILSVELSRNKDLDKPPTLSHIFTLDTP